MTNVFMWVTSRPADGLPVHAWLGDRLVKGQLRPCPTPPNPCVPPRCKPARSAFFRAGVRILDFDLATLALADSQPGVAPGPVTLPGDRSEERRVGKGCRISCCDERYQ